MDNKTIKIEYKGEMYDCFVFGDYKVVIQNPDDYEHRLELDQCTRCGVWKSEDEEMYSDLDGNNICDSCSEFCEGCDQYFSTDYMVNSVDGNRCCPKCSDKVTSIVWSTDDIFLRAKEKHFNISEQQAIEILHKMKRNHDAKFGITWDIIGSYIDDIGK